jgi:hypothetical protein
MNTHTTARADRKCTRLMYGVLVSTAPAVMLIGERLQQLSCNFSAQ